MCEKKHRNNLEWHYQCIFCSTKKREPNGIMSVLYCLQIMYFFAILCLCSNLDQTMFMQTKMPFQRILFNEFTGKR